MTMHHLKEHSINKLKQYILLLTYLKSDTSYRHIIQLNSFYIRSYFSISNILFLYLIDKIYQ